MKIKTKKAVSKRFKITKTGKIIARTTGQDHFNSAESGNVTRAKRKDKQINSSIKKIIKKQLAK